MDIFRYFLMNKNQENFNNQSKIQEADKKGQAYASREFEFFTMKDDFGEVFFIKT